MHFIDMGKSIFDLIGEVLGRLYEDQQAADHFIDLYAMNGIKLIDKNL
jgi:hypothetical protein